RHGRALLKCCVYSSETGVWGEITSIHMPDSFVVPLPTVLVGNTLYWLLDNDHIIQFDLDKHRLDLIEEVPHSYCKQVIIMPAEDGLVGFAGVDGSSLHLWSRVGSIDGGVPWTRRIIDFEELLGPETSLCHPLLVGYAEDADVIFICADTSVYMIHLKSMMKIERWNELDIVFPIFPYTRFYSPAVKALGAYCLAAEPSSFSAVPSLAYSVSRMPGSRSTLAGERPRRRHALQPAGERRPW
uniref:F-box associated domain-containing protein n=1 Tax=Aegilops tauschii subsp. strangulata TaxID=200361 RepID=A0A453Q737_AEGTS